jgi:hypothetical protein
MKSFLLFLLLLLAAGSSLSAQNLIAIQNGDTPTFYTNLDSAIVHAQNGDTIYIPGGIFNINRQINKRIYIIGIGHNVNYSSATGYTLLTGDILLQKGASGGLITGAYISGAIRYGRNDYASNSGDSLMDVDDFIISRCNISYILLYSTSQGCFGSNLLASNNLFIENIIRGNSTLSNSTNHKFYNNIIQGTVRQVDQCILKNNIFLYSGDGTNNNSPIIAPSNCIIENNIFFGPKAFSRQYLCYYYKDMNNDIINNNLFLENITSFCGTCYGYNNIINQLDTSIFINHTGNSFNYSNDYHLKSDSPGKFAGKDGTDIGIYGGSFPWKEGSIPFNPHYQEVQIAPQTDNQGNLNVKIKVSAQDH